jgi:multiple sugar transport system ATP-binding protein
MASVTLSGVRKSFGSTEVVHGVDVGVEDGEFCVLVGPSGCGKSTLLRMIAGLEEISGGRIAIGDRVVNGVAPKERDIAMVFQNYALYPHMSVYDNMAFSLKLAGEPREQTRLRVEEAALILGLEEYLLRYPRQLSGGQRQRVAMGRAIVRKPQVFLFDEPLSNLDAKLRVAMRTEIKALHQRLKTTSLYVTHDQIEAMTMADKIVVMNAGRVEQIGSPRAARWWSACGPSTLRWPMTACPRRWSWSSPPAPTRRSSASSPASPSRRSCASATRFSRAQRCASSRSSLFFSIRRAGRGSRNVITQKEGP